MSVDLEVDEADDGTRLDVLLVRRVDGMSRAKARRLIQGGGARLNDQVIQDENASVSLKDLTGDGVLKLSKGKKNHVLVRPV